MTAAIVVLAWLAISAAIGPLVGRCIAYGNGGMQ